MQNDVHHNYWFGNACARVHRRRPTNDRAPRASMNVFVYIIKNVLSVPGSHHRTHLYVNRSQDNVVSHSRCSGLRRLAFFLYFYTRCFLFTCARSIAPRVHRTHNPVSPVRIIIIIYIIYSYERHTRYPLG